MYRVTIEIDFCYGHRLLEYQGRCAHPHGHNGRVQIDVCAEALDRRGMVVDFGEIKSAVRKWMEAHLDHRMILRKDDPLVGSLEGLGEPFFPMEVNPTAEGLAKLIFDGTTALGFPVAEVRFWETPASCATYRP
jgi:6-pyruvoyltetrahydropterin/6-carboxytetrahydropterin synthase